MKERLHSLLEHAVAELKAAGALPPDTAADLQLTRTKDPSHGDFSSNLALRLARPLNRNPLDLAKQLREQIVQRMPTSGVLEKVEVAGPGFINFFLRPGATLAVIQEILDRGPQYGRNSLGAGRSIQVEFVSANPTGPLHVGHGRGAAYGAAVADLLEAVGFTVHREYYVNDDGRQMDILATSVWLRYLERCGVPVAFPSNGYRGGYVREIAATVYAEHAAEYRCTAEDLMKGLPRDEHEGGDKEAYIDAVVERAHQLLGDNRYRYIFELALNAIVDDIREDLNQFGIHYENWYSERSLVEKGSVNKAIERLRAAGYVYEKEDALWFRSTAFDDEKDRVLQRGSGHTTYFASDIAYHLDKLERGFERIIDVWGADHHGYVPRIRAALKALGESDEKLDVLLVQFANLYRGGVKVQMSTRSGEFVTLRELREEVGRDAARFFYVMRRCEQHLDFDLDLAKSQSADNPVYYIQYAHARICSVFRQFEDRGLQRDAQRGQSSLTRLCEDQELSLINRLSYYPEIVEQAALTKEPHQLAHYLRDLANDFHSYYNAHQFLVGDPALRDARLNLCEATRHVISNGLTLLGVSAPREM